MAGHFMVDHLLGPVIMKLIEACHLYLKDQVRWQTGMKEELQSLQENLPHIQAVVSFYSQLEIKDSALNKWYWQLRDAIDEADDVLDEFEYYSKREKEMSKKRKISKVRSLMKYLKKRFVKFCKRALKIDPNLKRLEEVVQKLSKISAGVSNFHILDRANQLQQQPQFGLHEAREMGSTPANVFVGRSEEMEFVNTWLKNSRETQSTDTEDLYRNISLLSVVGLEGMGKTTLLQHVYKDATTLFDLQMWVCVSTIFDVKVVMANILKSLKILVSNEEPIDSLQKRLKAEVNYKRFLLVLDDIWEADEKKWKIVLAALLYGSSGSMILLTTQMNSVASTFANMIKNYKFLQLDGLKKGPCLELLNTHAFAGEDNLDKEFIESIDVNIVEKLSRCPLAAKIIGGILNLYKDKRYWIEILKTDIGKVRPGDNELLPILKLSYIYLPKFLQNCFTFCCIFPQDHEFDKDDLVKMWIALGFIQSSNNQEETLEDTGRSYFNMLVQKSFFDEFHNYKDKVCYKMPKLLHELAQFVSGQECFRIEGDKAFSIPKTIRHLSIDDVSSLEATFKRIGEFKNLRSLFLSFSKVSKLDENVISQFLKASKSIRLLAINPRYDYNMPETINCLIHLRYLKVGYWNLKLSRSISHLDHLQFVISNKPQNFVMDTTGGDWEELRPNKNCHLIMTDELVIRYPSLLQMEPLRSISYLRFLTIQNNDNLVSFSREIEQWFMQHSSSLIGLKFEKLQSLQSLPFSLESLSSLGYLKVSIVPQLKLLSKPPASLKELHLYNLESLECLPSSLSTISSLTNLTLKNILLLRSLPDLPSSLEELVIEELESLQYLPSSLSTISSLTNLTLKNIPLLRSLPDLPSSLEELVIEEFELLQCLPSSLSTISSLTNLTLKNTPLFKSLPVLPSSIITLYLEDLKSLQWLPSSFSTVSPLKRLELKNIPRLESLPDLPSSLITLYLEDLESLERLPSLSTLSSLTRLKLENIPLLKSLPERPSSLKEIEIKGLESLHY